MWCVYKTWEPTALYSSYIFNMGEVTFPFPRTTTADLHAPQSISLQCCGHYHHLHISGFVKPVWLNLWSTGPCHPAHRVSYGFWNLAALIAMVSRDMAINTATAPQLPNFWTHGEPHGPNGIALQIWHAGLLHSQTQYRASPMCQITLTDHMLTSMMDQAMDQLHLWDPTHKPVLGYASGLQGQKVENHWIKQLWYLLLCLLLASLPTKAIFSLSLSLLSLAFKSQAKLKHHCQQSASTAACTLDHFRNVPRSICAHTAVLLCPQ